MKTAESVTPNHPDKLCDRISDALLDAILTQDPNARVALETMGGHGIITVTGEVTTTAYVNVPDVVKIIVGDKYGIQTNIVSQSPEIANGVDTGGAGDQGIMVGYACNDNEDMIPQEVYLARSLCRFIYEKFPFDGKTQITLKDDGTIDTIVASFQNVISKELRKMFDTWLDTIDPIVNPFGQQSPTIHANPAGDWKQGGFDADTGLTGRKIAVDCYGPQIPIGGGAFSGKDSTKVDRSAAYMARYLAVYYLKHIGGEECIVKLAYAIGVSEPVMVDIKVDGNTIEINNGWNLTPNGIINYLDLRKPQFEKTAQFGHFGNGFKWDK